MTVVYTCDTCQQPTPPMNLTTVSLFAEYTACAPTVDPQDATTALGKAMPDDAHVCSYCLEGFLVRVRHAFHTKVRRA